MKNPVSSFPAKSPIEHTALRWYHEPWPWLLMAGPFIVVIAALATAWMAVKSDDGIVAQDYYKQGLLINQRLGTMAPDPERRLGAIIAVTPNGKVRAHMQGLDDAPPSLRLRFSHTAPGSHAEIVTLERAPDGDYVGEFPAQTPGRWIVTLEGDGWRLPTTTVSGHLSEIRLGTANPS